MSSHPLTQLVLCRIREFIREPEAVFWAILFPVVLSVGLGIAFRNRPAEILIVAATSPALADSLRAAPGLSVELMAADDARNALRLGKVVLVAEATADGGVVLRFDDTNPQGRSARLLADNAIQRAAGRVDPIRVADDQMREPGSRYIDFVVPGLVGLNIMSNAIWGLGFSIVDSRRRRLIKRLVATPMSRAHYLLAHLIWRLMILVVEVAVPIGFGALAFGVPIRGSLVELGAICLLASLSFSALGLLIASRATTIEGVSGLMNVTQVPMWILSGVFFSAQRFPDLVQPFIKALPLTAAIDAMRGNMLQGSSLFDLAPELAVLGGWLVVCFVLALKLFRWR
jgi:ABC-type multidrug transport system permease subunit